MGLQELAEAAKTELARRESLSKDGGYAPTFSTLMQEHALQDWLPCAVDTLRDSIWCAFSYAQESGEDPLALVKQSFSEFADAASAQLGTSSAKKQEVEEILAKAGRVLSSRNESQLRSAMEAMSGVLQQLDKEPDPEPEQETAKDALYTITEKNEDLRRTTGVLYVPNRKDAHDEYATAEDLENAVAEYVKSGDMQIRLQHDTDAVAGQTIGIIAWPRDEEVTLTQADGTAKQAVLPAGTIYQSVEWSPEAWAAVKANELKGYSLGGLAVKMRGDEDLPTMGE